MQSTACVSNFLQQTFFIPREQSKIKITNYKKINKVNMILSQTWDNKVSDKKEKLPNQDIELFS